MRNGKLLRKQIFQLLKSETGVTLVELLMVLAISGLLFMALAVLFRIGMQSWILAVDMTRFQLNAGKLSREIGRDVRASERVLEIHADMVVLQQPAGQVRYIITEAPVGRRVVRQQYDEATKTWQYMPRHSVADFSGTDTMLRFRQVNIRQVQVTVEGVRGTVETTFCPRL